MTNVSVGMDGFWWVGMDGFWWDGVWHPMKDSAGDDDGPPTGVREPRRPRRPAPSGAAAREPEPELEGAR